jgi:hypothetical protein
MTGNLLIIPKFAQQLENPGSGGAYPRSLPGASMSHEKETEDFRF